jgi:hypothetical protein
MVRWGRRGFICLELGMRKKEVHQLTESVDAEVLIDEVHAEP